MQENNLKTVAIIPPPDVFRAWLGPVLIKLKVSGVRLGRELDLGKNTIGGFLKNEGRGIDMRNAHKIQAWLVSTAAAAGVDLPTFDDAAAALRGGND